MTFDRALQDLKFAVRSLLKRPGFTLVAVFSLALGVGANSAIFSLVNGLFFKKPTLTQPSELIEIYRLVRGEDHFFVSHHDVEDVGLSGAELFTGVTAYKFFVGQVGGEGGGGQVVTGELVSGNYFDLLGVRAALGRTFVAEKTRGHASRRTVPRRSIRHGSHDVRVGAARLDRRGDVGRVSTGAQSESDQSDGGTAERVGLLSPPSGYSPLSFASKNAIVRRHASFAAASS